MDEMESRSSGMVDFAHDDFEDQLAMPSMSYRDGGRQTDGISIIRSIPADLLPTGTIFQMKLIEISCQI